MLPTSGSTGAPKYVIVHRRCLATGIPAGAAVYGHALGNRQLCLLPAHLKFTVMNVLSSLHTGGSCVVLPFGNRLAVVYRPGAR